MGCYCSPFASIISGAEGSARVETRGQLRWQEETAVPMGALEIHKGTYTHSDFFAKLVSMFIESEG